jgi:uncharacterized protein YndB with AHSA1/START domain
VGVSKSSIHIEASRETVWSVVTEPAYVEQWQYGSQLQTDWSVRSQVRFISEWQGQTFEQWGTVVQVDAPNRVASSLFAHRPDLEDKPENYFTMTYVLDGDEGATTLTILQEDPRPVAEDTVEDEEDNPALAALKTLAESAGK